MNKTKQKPLVPKLRFPEFREKEGWLVFPFENLFERVTRRNKNNNSNALTISAQLGLVSQLDYFNKKVASRDLSNYYLLKKGEFAYNKSYSNGYPVGAIKSLKLYDEGVVSVLYICFKLKGDDCGIFFEHYFESGIFDFQIGRIAQEGGRANGLLNVSVHEFFKDLVLYRPIEQEQQKIADCLSSLDELISTQAQKIDGLKAHKKGLMQKLFPTEGQTTPQLRFPEFRESGEWIEFALSDCAEYENGKAHEKSIIDDGRYIVVNSKFISTDGEVCKFSNAAHLLAKNNDILMVLSDVPNGRAIAKCFYVAKNDTYTVNQRICKLTPKGVVSQFLYLILNRNKYFLRFDDGVKQTNLKKDDVLECPLTLPKDDDNSEQQKIADCLSSLDELISAHQQKLDTLKAHKKGLMQQLFPSIDEYSDE